MTKETLDLYTPDQHAETTEGITAMAIRFNVRGNDVIHALWFGLKDTVWAKLALDLKDRKKEIKREKAEMLKMEAAKFLKIRNGKRGENQNISQRGRNKKR